MRPCVQTADNGRIAPILASSEAAFIPLSFISRAVFDDAKLNDAESCKEIEIGFEKVVRYGLDASLRQIDLQRVH